MIDGSFGNHSIAIYHDIDKEGRTEAVWGVLGYQGSTTDKFKGITTAQKYVAFSDFVPNLWFDIKGKCLLLIGIKMVSVYAPNFEYTPLVFFGWAIIALGRPALLKG